MPMSEIQKIIKFLDDTIEKRGITHLSPVEGNKILDEARLLNDSSDRPGLPLRKLLRAGSIPHAYQLGGKNSPWFIPQSSKFKSRTQQSSLQTEKTKDSPTGPKNNKSSTDLEELQSQIEEARNSYKPEIIKYVLIAEAPPNSIDRFFYYPDVKTADYLFLGVMGVLFPDRKRKYIASGRPESMKKDLLRDFQEKGFFLLDLLDLPINLYSESLENAVPSLVDKLKKSVNVNTPIILIKANVYDLAFQPLVSNGFKNTVSLRIPFPGQGWQTEFGIKFREALETSGYGL
jgi:hypothetical protein